MTEESLSNSSSEPDLAAMKPADICGPVLQTLGSVFGLGTLLLEYGFVRIDAATNEALNPAPVPANVLYLVRYLAITLFVLAFWWRATARSGHDRFVRTLGIDFVLATVATAGIVLLLAGGRLLSEAQMQILQQGLLIYLIIQLWVTIGRFFLFVAAAHRDPVRGLFLAFPTAILLGAAALSLPAAVYSPLYPDFGNNLLSQIFTATSAVCLAGLTVHDMATYYTPFGHVVILLLIQFGGFAIVLLGAIAWTLVIQREPAACGGPRRPTVDVPRLAKSIIVVMVLAEAIGAIFLYPLWQTFSVPQAAFRSIFHAVSALCNSGFTLQSNGWVGFADAWQTYLVILPLVILGGLGYPVWRDLATRGRPTGRTGMIMLASLALIVFGMLAIGRIERPRNAHRWGRDVQYEDLAIKTDPGQMRNHSPGQRALDALFLAANARSGGFATVDIADGKLSPGALGVLIALMTIGGAPASAAGGITTLTFVILLTTAIAALRGRSARAGNPRQAAAPDSPGSALIRQAAVVFFLYVGVLWFITTALAVTHPQISFLDLFFEAASACGCSGLSTGVTPHLNLAGRLLLILAFLFGRLAPLAVVFALARAREVAGIGYLSDKI